MVLWIFSSLLGKFLVIRQISAGIKMETEFLEHNEGHTIILLFAERVHGKMRHEANNAGHASWRGKRSSRSSSSSSVLVAWRGKLSLLHDYWIFLLVHPKLTDQEDGTPTLTGKHARRPAFGWCRSYLRCAGEKRHYISVLKLASYFLFRFFKVFQCLQ